MDLLDRINRWGNCLPERPAHRSGDQLLTWGELTRRSDVLAAHLAESGEQGVPVAIVGHKEPALLVGFLAAAKAGRPYVPLDTAMPELRRDRIVALAGADPVLTPGQIDALSAGLVTAPDRGLGPDATYYIMFTSGSTGEPKGVVITHGCLTSFIDWMVAEQQFEEGGEVFLNQAPFSFDLSIMDTYLSLVTGGTLVSLTRAEVADPKRLYQALVASDVTTWVSTPSFARLCLAERGFDHHMLPRVRRFLFCGETLLPDTARHLLERFPDAAIWNTYGPTEATVATTSIRVDAALIERYPTLPIGHAMPGTHVLVQDAAGQTALPGERGELIIAGPNVSPGYLGRSDLTERAFFRRDGQPAYRTGDWGRVCDGLLFCEGRMDDQVKVAGHRIELGDVEANLRALPGVRDAVALVLRRERRQEMLAAVVVPTDDGSDPAMLVQALRAGLAERLPAYMTPRSLTVLDSIPLTPNGKADRRGLAELLVSSATRRQP